MKIAIIDYGMGNLRSVEKALHYVGAPGAFVTSDAAEIEAADKAVLPGDGAFDTTMDSLRESGIDQAAQAFAASGRPLLGICIGMQVMLTASEEGRDGVAGLSLVPGQVLKFIPGQNRLRVPQIGWNRLRAENSSRLLHGFGLSEPYIYCLHSYYCAPDSPEFIAGTVEYGVRYCAAVERGNIFATQFHPEKSGDAGLHILRNFVTHIG